MGVAPAVVPVIRKPAGLYTMTQPSLTIRDRPVSAFVSVRYLPFPQPASVRAGALLNAIACRDR
jgi:hypothetical protein